MLMAEHKVPQNVEAEDKLIGPFSFRQFVYLMIAVALGFFAFILGQIAFPLAVIPAPFCLFFLVIALPLRKDQPTEIYVAALLKYYFKPRVRIWKADGEQPLVEISNPTTDEGPKTKDIAGDEVSRRLSFLANLSDTQGWSVRGMGAPVNNTNLNDEFASDAINFEDVMEDSSLSNSIDHMLDRSEQKMRQNAIEQMKRAMQRMNANTQVSNNQTPLNDNAINDIPTIQTATSTTTTSGVELFPVNNAPSGDTAANVVTGSISTTSLDSLDTLPSADTGYLTTPDQIEGVTGAQIFTPSSAQIISPAPAKNVAAANINNAVNTNSSNNPLPPVAPVIEEKHFIAPATKPAIIDSSNNDSMASQIEKEPIIDIKFR